MSARTPGPWRVGPVDDTAITAAHKGQVAITVGDYLSEWQRMEADARLIAAAPDLLEALSILASLPSDTPPPGITATAWQAALAAAEAAIAKAEDGI